MVYRIRGLDPASLRMTATDPAVTIDTGITQAHAISVVATSDTGYPCRITLEDARIGDDLVLMHFVHHNVATPFRSAHAIYIRSAAMTAADHIDTPPPIFARRTLSLRGFTASGMLHAATIAPPGAADAAIRILFADPAVAYVHAHNAAYGCFLAAATRHGADA